jgi:hypothetical protein
VHTYKEPSRHEDTVITVQQAKRQRGVHTYKEPSIYEDTMINVQQGETERSAHIQGTKQI